MLLFLKTLYALNTTSSCHAAQGPIGSAPIYLISSPSQGSSYTCLLTPYTYLYSYSPLFLEASSCKVLHDSLRYSPCKTSSDSNYPWYSCFVWCPPTLAPGWSMWPKEHGRSDGMWLLKLGSKRWQFLLCSLKLLTLVEACPFAMRTLRKTSAVVLVNRNPLPPAMWVSQLGSVSSSSNQAFSKPSQDVSATSWGSWRLKHPTEPLSNYWPIETEE